MLPVMVYRKLPLQVPDNVAPEALHPVLHWFRRVFKLLAALVLIPPVLLMVLVYFSAWKAVSRWRA